MPAHKLYEKPSDKYAAYRARRRAANPQPAPAPKVAPPAFVAIDGEGWDKGKKHLYTLLGASDGSYVSGLKGLKTRQCLDYLLSLRAQYPKAVFVSYGFDYDVNMIVGDIPATALARLRARGRTLVFDGRNPGYAYRIGFISGKWFDVDYGPVTRNEQGTPRVSSKKSLRIYDAFGFFQASFVATLDAWEIDTPEVRDAIRSMKDKRAEFARMEFLDVQTYNHSECLLLVDLMTRLKAALDGAGIKISQWYGAGAISSALLQAHSVKAHRGDEPPADVSSAIMGAYYGGRIQLLQPGIHAPAFSHDLNSAYPSAMVDLPSLVGRWRKARAWEFHKTDAQWALWRVSWELPSDTPVTPFPWRDTDGAIRWPTSGAGWYWGPEVDAAWLAFGDAVTVHEGYVFTPTDADARPFSWVSEWYQKRLDFIADGNPAEKVIKYGLNGLYGKLAQGTGIFGRGPYQSFMWAGLVTSITRARLLARAMSDPDAVICFATDNVFSTRPLAEHEQGKPLGGWEVQQADELFIVQPGMYEARTGSSIVRRVRGFRVAEVDFPKLRRAWEVKGVLASQSVAVRRFVGMRGANARQKPDLWRRWVKERRKMSAYPQRGFSDVMRARSVRVHGEDCAALGLSRAYVPKGQQPALDDRYGAAHYEVMEQPTVEV